MIALAADSSTEEYTTARENITAPLSDTTAVDDKQTTTARGVINEPGSRRAQRVE